MLCIIGTFYKPTKQESSLGLLKRNQQEVSKLMLKQPFFYSKPHDYTFGNGLDFRLSSHAFSQRWVQRIDLTRRLFAGELHSIKWLYAVVTSYLGNTKPHWHSRRSPKINRCTIILLKSRMRKLGNNVILLNVIKKTLVKSQNF